MKSFGQKIITWYNSNKRDLPWRKTKDPYQIWLSEVILQQTRVDQGMSYYQKFILNYPTVEVLAHATEDQILKDWQGLGYYSRARNLHFTAKEIVSKYNGVFPSTYEEIRSLKGIGDYTAAAISSFAFNLPYSVVDGNVYRILSRFAGISTPIDSTEGKKEFSLLAQQLLSKHSPQLYNQAIMEFGSLQCKPAKPNCLVCPLSNSCFAYENNKVDVLPVKTKSIKIRKRYFHYLVIRDGNEFYIKKRKSKDIWIGLHDFPMIETKQSTEIEELTKSAEWRNQLGKSKHRLEKVTNEYKHILSHQHIHAKFYEIKTDLKKFNEAGKEWKKVNRESVNDYAVPRLIEDYLNQ